MRSSYVDGGTTKKRVLLARLVHKTNTFVGGRTGLQDFAILRGEEIIRAGGEGDPISGMLEVAMRNGWEVLHVVDMRAASGAAVADPVIVLFWAEFRAVADREQPRGVDGVFLVLDGATVSESHYDMEGEVLRRIRSLGHLSDVPICGVISPRTNFTEAIRRQSDGLIAYRKDPTDTRDAASLAATILDGLVQTEIRPATVWEHPPIMCPLSGTATDNGPMLVLEGRAREIEAGLPDVLAVNVLCGFSYADVPEAGVGFSAVTTGDLELLTRGALRELNVMASSLREAGSPPLVPPEEATSRLEEHREGPVLLVEPSDNVGAGAAGDATRVLRALVERGVPDAGVMINDPETVAVLRDAEPGERRGVEIGGKSGDFGSEPLALVVELVSRSVGRFLPEEHLRSVSAPVPDDGVDMGPCALVRHGGVLLTSRRTPPFDLGQWRSQGVDPEDLFAIGVNAATEHRDAYESIATASYTLDLPGPCAGNLTRLPFENVMRPIYPLDDL